MYLIISLLFGVAFAGVAYVLLQAFASSAESYSGAYAEDTARRFEDLFLFVSPRRVAEAGWAAGLAFFLVSFLFTGSFRSARGVVVGLFFGVLMGGLALRSPRWLVQILRKRRRHRFDLQLVDALLGMSNALKAGFSIAQAFESLVKERQNPISQEFALFLQQTRVGVSFSEALDNLEKDFPNYDGGGYEIAGFIWMQGWNDMCTPPAIPEYAENLVNLVKDLRAEFQSPELPVVIGELGNGGSEARGNMAAFREAQKRGAQQIDNAAFVITHNFWRDPQESPNVSHGHHWCGNAESYFLIGDVLGKAAVKLIEAEGPKHSGPPSAAEVRSSLEPLAAVGDHHPFPAAYVE